MAVFRLPASRRPGARAALALLLAGLGLLAAAQDTSSWFGGNLAARESASSGPGLEGWSWGSTASLSAGLGVRGQRSRAEASFEAAALEGSSAAAALAAARADPGLLALGDSETALSLRLRTLWVKLDLGGPSLELGRQVINFGRGALWSPVDLFASLDISGASPDRLGTDALRLDLPLGELSGLQALAAPSSSPEEGRYALRAFGDLGGLDGGLLGAWDGGLRRLLAGADCKFDLGPSFYAEALWSLAPAARDPLASSWLRAAGGLDWSLGDFIAAAEYYWNGGGSAALTSLDPAFPSRHYGYATLLWNFSDFGRLGLAATAELGGLLEEGGPLRIGASLGLDSSQNSRLGANLDLIRGDFSTEAAGGWRGSAGASLTVTF